MKEFLTYTTPEAAGISSENVSKFLDELERFGVYLHSFALLKGNAVFAEGYREPFHAEELHRMYSISKTFAAMAVGVLIGDKKLNLTDKIISFFPEYEDTCTDPNILDATVEDLLKMNAPFADVPTYCAHVPGYLETNWLRTFFTTSTTHPSGTVWNYDTSATYILGVITERITNMPFMDLLYQRVLRKIGCSEGVHCLKTPDDYSWNGSAVFCTTMDLARFARLIMMGGAWDGEQLIPADFVAAAISRQTDNNSSGFADPVNGRGYGYQIWCTMDNTYAFLGMGNQLAICMPEEDLLFVCTADHQGDLSIRPIIFTSLWHNIKEKASVPLAEDLGSHKKLLDKCTHMPYPVVEGAMESDIALGIWGKKIILHDNPMKITEIIFLKSGNGHSIMRYTNAQGQKEIPFDFGKAVVSEFPQDGYGGKKVGVPMDRRFRCITSGAWTMPNTLRIKCDIIDIYLGNINMLFVFKGNQVGIHFQRNAQWLLDEYNGYATGEISAES